MSIIRIITFPFSLLYGLAVRIRNLLYDKHLLHSVEFDLPVICVGNLSVGGTGKTPMVEYLIDLIGSGKSLAVLSRGYKRKTKGFRFADENSDAFEIGDEPMQMHRKHPEVTIAVSEQRVPAIPQILHERPETKVILLDDAFQHRPLRAGMNILLTTYANPFSRDLLLPAGNLRDNRLSAKRASVIVVTKCPADLSITEKDSLILELRQQPEQPVYFASMRYGKFYSFFENEIPHPHKDTTAMLVCGIANPAPILSGLRKITDKTEQMFFKDHHPFTMGDLKKIREKFEGINNTQKVIIITEKDAARLSGFKKELSGLPVLIWPVTQQLLFNEGTVFDNLVLDFIRNFPASE